MTGPYRSTAPDPMRASEQSWLRRVVTRVWRKWQVYLYGRYRDRAARCEVCGKPFPWESRDVTVVPLCPQCHEERQREPVVWVCQRCAPVTAKPLVREVPPVVECPVCGARCVRGVTEVQAVRKSDLQGAERSG